MAVSNRRFRVTLNRWRGRECSEIIVRTMRSFDSAAEAAEKLADRVQVGTRYRRANDVVTVERRTARGWREVHICDDRIVPSVGELGYTP